MSVSPVLLRGQACVFLWLPESPWHQDAKPGELSQWLVKDECGGVCWTGTAVVSPAPLSPGARPVLHHPLGLPDGGQAAVGLFPQMVQGTEKGGYSLGYPRSLG